LLKSYQQKEVKMNLRYAFSFLRILKIPGLYPIMQDWMTSVRMNFIFTAYESGLLHTLSKPGDRNTLIKKLGVERTALLDALLEVGLAVKELAVKNEQFFIRGRRSKAIVGTNGDMLAAMIQADRTYYSDAYRNAASRMRGGELGEDLDKIGDVVARFSKMTEPIIKDFMAYSVNGKHSMRVLDVGCGSAFLLRTIYELNKNAKGIGLDIDQTVVDQAKQNITAWGLTDRFSIYHGNILEYQAENDHFDLISLVNILYYFDKGDRVELLSRMRKLLVNNGKLAIVMSFHSKGNDIGTANLNLVNSSLKGLTPLPDLDQIKSLLKQCGLGKIKVHRFMPKSTFYGIIASKF
jgi:SAM-dependent methyltransferase